MSTEEDYAIKTAGDYFWKHAARAVVEFECNQSVYRAIQAAIAAWHVADATYHYWKRDKAKRAQFPPLSLGEARFREYIAGLSEEMRLCRELANVFKHFEPNSGKTIKSITAADLVLRAEVMSGVPMPGAPMPSFVIMGARTVPKVVVRISATEEREVLPILNAALSQWEDLDRDHGLFGDRPAAWVRRLLIARASAIPP